MSGSGLNLGLTALVGPRSPRSTSPPPSFCWCLRKRMQVVALASPDVRRDARHHLRQRDVAPDRCAMGVYTMMVTALAGHAHHGGHQVALQVFWTLTYFVDPLFVAATSFIARITDEGRRACGAWPPRSWD